MGCLCLILAEVTSCWRKQPDGSVGEQCDCPPHVMKGRDNGRCASLVVAQLGQCMAADKQQAVVYLYGELGLYEEAVERALGLNNLDLALANAERVPTFFRLRKE